MRRTKHYRKQKGRRTRRNIRTKVNKRIHRKTRKMKGGFASLKDAYNTLKYDFSKAIDIGMGNPSEVAPAVKGGDNPLPFKQLGAADDINSYNIASTPSPIPV